MTRDRSALVLAAILTCGLGQRPATVVRVVDGDTAVLRLNLGFETQVEGPARLLGVDAPELPTPAGLAAREWLRARLPVGAGVCFAGDRRDKYGRPLVLIYDAAGIVNDDLVTAGEAVRYP